MPLVGGQAEREMSICLAVHIHKWELDNEMMVGERERGVCDLIKFEERICNGGVENFANLANNYKQCCQFRKVADGNSKLSYRRWVRNL